MSTTLGSGSLSPAAGASAAPEVEGHWAPHGAVLTACVVGINVLVILLIFGFFWRFFSGKGGPPSTSDDGADDEDEDSLPVALPWASRHRHDDRLGVQSTPVEDVASSLPVSVYSSAGSGAEEGGGKAPECAVCIVELRDGDSVRVLPRCGHRFHADCVGAWLRLHATCPLCRGRVVAPAAAAVADASRNAKDHDDNVAADDCPV
ncbi:RING-H2 finger protein ATL3-like [Miscanthus floridulus]|uniref:RING-H2 finger protein ATL3-like n=1 Tax=Miscanthus floridulus TaxID=154761 RepID=UPI003457CCAE